MSSGRSSSLAALALLALSCSQAVTEARAVGHCDLQVAYVEGGSAPAVSWMRLCDDSIEFQPLGRKAVVRRPSPNRRSALRKISASPDFAAAITDLARKFPHHAVPPDHAFYVIRYSGQEIHVTPDQLPPVVRNLFVALNAVFKDAYPSYQDFLAQ